MSSIINIDIYPNSNTFVLLHVVPKSSMVATRIVAIEPAFVDKLIPL